jgi:predicted DNA-binding antitoxin AbrB/MazE fold protein
VSRVIEAVYEKGVLRPLEKLDLPDGARVELRIVGIYGLLKDWRIDPQKLKNELRGLHG